MRAAVSVSPREVEVRDLPEPAGRVVRVLACGVCGSDVNEGWVARKVPAVLGHEIVGEDVATGERVVLHHHAPCGTCARCARGRETLCEHFKATALDPGGFAERVGVPADLDAEVLTIGDLPVERAVFCEPLACVLRALDRARLRPDDRLLVVGCGSSGLLAVLAARARGVAVSVLEPREDRRSLALDLGAAAHDGEADVALVCTAKAAAIEAGFRALAPGGVLVLYGVPEPGDELRLDALAHYVREITVVPSYSAGPRDMRAALALLQEIDPSPLVTHRFGLDEAARALEVQRTGAGVKALVLP